MNHDWRIDLSRYLPIKEGEGSKKSDLFLYRSTKRRVRIRNPFFDATLIDSSIY